MIEELYGKLQTIESGWNSEFGEADAEALASLIMKVKHFKMVVIEVGSWKGCSSAVIASVIKTVGGTLWCIDHWQGNTGVRAHEEASHRDILAVFRANMRSLGFFDIVYPIVADSLSASRMMNDNIADIVFIDADHHYQAVKRDIAIWLPKVKKGGIISGHDCEVKYSELSSEGQKQLLDDSDKGTDFEHGLHAGVIRAVWETFKSGFEILPQSSIWYTGAL